MPKTHGQPKLRPPKRTSTKRQPKARGKGSPSKHKSQLRSYKQTTSYKHPKRY